MSLKSAVIGTGVISEEHLSFLQHASQAELVGVCDLSPAAAEYAADRFGATAAYTDHRVMLEQAKPDVVHILTPPSTHERLAEECLTAGAHVLCEKPIALSSDKLETLLSKAQQANRVLMEDHNYRFNRPVLAIEKLIKKGTLGNISDVEVRMHLGIRGTGGRYGDPNLSHPSHKLPGGVLHEFVTHLGYLLLRFTGGFDHATALWRNHGGGDMFKYDSLDAMITHNKIQGRLRFSSSSAPDTFTIIVRGDKGSVQTDLFQPHLKLDIPRAGGGVLSPFVNQMIGGLNLTWAGWCNFYDKLMQRSAYEGLHTLLNQTYTALATNKPVPITPDDMRGVSRLVDALLAEENRR